MGCGVCAEGRWVASPQQITSTVRRADVIHYNGCRMAVLRNHPVQPRYVRGVDRTWEATSRDLARRCGVEESPSKTEAGVGRTKWLPCSAASRADGLGSARESGRRAGLNKGLSTGISRTAWIPRRRGSSGKSADRAFFRGVWTGGLFGVRFAGGEVGGSRQAAAILPASPEPVPVQPVGLRAGKSSCEGSFESLSWHMPSKALIIDVYCIAHMCCTWQPARELKAARVLYLSCYFKNQIICISFWHCFFSLGSVCQGSQCVQRSVCYV